MLVLTALIYGSVANRDDVVAVTVAEVSCSSAPPSLWCGSGARDGAQSSDSERLDPNNG
jgi:hypothetical protein